MFTRMHWKIGIVEYKKKSLISAV